MQGLLEAKALYGPKIGLVGRFLFYGYSSLIFPISKTGLIFKGKLPMIYPRLQMGVTGKVKAPGCSALGAFGLLLYPYFTTQTHC